MVTIRKLAELAGVSHMTVWLALHEKPGIRPEVRARVLALADEYHYHPNRLAAGMFSGHTRTIGLIVEHVTWYSRLCDGVMSAAFRDQAHVIILNAGQGQGDGGHLPPLIDHLIDQRVDGIIFAAGLVVLPSKSVLAMWSHDIVPVLTSDVCSDKPLDRLATDERRLAHSTVEYLLHLGHQRIAYYGLEPQRSRTQEMRRALQGRGLSLDYAIDDVTLTAPDARMTEQYLDFLLHKPHPPTAVICFQDQMATQLLQHAQRRGLRVPGDLSILGCSNDSVGFFLMPALTSVEQFPEEAWCPRLRANPTPAPGGDCSRRTGAGDDPDSAAVNRPRVVWPAETASTRAYPPASRSAAAGNTSSHCAYHGRNHGRNCRYEHDDRTFTPHHHRPVQQTRVNDPTRPTQ